MRVILVQDFPPLGKMGEVKEVAGGYARNFLLPRGIALPATPENLKGWQEKLKAWQKRQLIEKERLAELASKLEGLTIQIQAPGKEKLYGAITSQKIAAELKKLNIDLDRRQIDLNPIKEPGEYQAVIRLGGDLNPKVKIIVSTQEK